MRRTLGFKQRRMASKFLRILFFIGLFALGAVAQCSSYGVDYVNGGSYDIDTSSHENFTFSTIFQGIYSPPI